MTWSDVTREPTPRVIRQFAVLCLVACIGMGLVEGLARSAPHGVGPLGSWASRVSLRVFGRQPPSGGSIRAPSWSRSRSDSSLRRSCWPFFFSGSSGSWRRSCALEDGTPW